MFHLFTHHALSAPSRRRGYSNSSIINPPHPNAPIACNRVAANDPERIDRIIQQLQASVHSGSARQLKDEKTWYCPNEDEVFGDQGHNNDPSNTNEEPPVGPPSLWIFTNRARTPVVVSWLRNVKGENVEVSALNPDISPAHHDPRAIVQPGEWKSLSLFLGHIFHVRELISVGGGELVPGRILVRHRAGPTPIKNRFGGPNLECPVQAIVDPEPDEGFDRVPFDYNRRCNALFQMFTNRMHCPVDVYYAGFDAARIDSKTAPMGGKNETAPLNSCEERFSFHLGVNPSSRPDYMDAWASPVAYEATYLTHKFVARLHHDHNIIVDEIVMDRTYIQDCPDRKKTSASASIADKEGILAGINDEEKNDSVFITDVNAALSARANTTSTIVVQKPVPPVPVVEQQSVAPRSCPAEKSKKFIELVSKEKASSVMCLAAEAGAVSSGVGL